MIATVEKVYSDGTLDLDVKKDVELLDCKRRNYDPKKGEIFFFQEGEFFKQATLTDIERDGRWGTE